MSPKKSSRKRDREKFSLELLCFRPCGLRMHRKNSSTPVLRVFGYFGIIGTLFFNTRLLYRERIRELKVREGCEIVLKEIVVGFAKSFSLVMVVASPLFRFSL